MSVATGYPYLSLLLPHTLKVETQSFFSLSLIQTM